MSSTTTPKSNDTSTPVDEYDGSWVTVNTEPRIVYCPTCGRPTGREKEMPKTVTITYDSKEERMKRTRRRINALLKGL